MRDLNILQVEAVIAQSQISLYYHTRGIAIITLSKAVLIECITQTNPPSKPNEKQQGRILMKL